MNPSRPTDDRPFADPARESEWQAQEQALRAEREHADGTHDDARQRSYRAIARALREPLSDALPADFATRVAQQAAARAQESADAKFATPFERVAIGLAIAFFGLAIGAALALSASTVLQPIGEALRQIMLRGSNSWLIALAACLAVSSALQRWNRGPSKHTS